ncbi:hypothetical protein FIBSPDRAFT_1050823 [Athelia psychrophila]|uniref:Uncharacterized protein n=1 Tax=Athelia psychrophila TaxID=1759441 RepID=A0A166A9J7_9AGAM|nr:hypothetical protein FIBSPDRAFT_1050823 [Fibularhizoctonia sp. CBS 109695]
MPPPCSSTHALAPSLSLHHANAISRTPTVAHTPSAAVVDVAEIVASHTRHDPSTRNRVPTRSNHIAAHPRNVERCRPRSPTRVHTSQDGTQCRPRGRHRRSHDFKPPPQRLRAFGGVYPALCARANPPRASRPSTLVNSHTDDTPQHGTEPRLHPATQAPSLAPSRPCPYILSFDHHIYRVSHAESLYEQAHSYFLMGSSAGSRPSTNGDDSYLSASSHIRRRRQARGRPCHRPLPGRVLPVVLLARAPLPLAPLRASVPSH